MLQNFPSYPRSRWATRGDRAGHRSRFSSQSNARNSKG
jgi:hypothetical protein